jgi:hypothetical protein
MESGLLWLDDRSNLSFAQKLEGAVSYYRCKYGGAPSVCYVHPSCLPTTPPDQTVIVRSAPDILPHHFWLGHAPQ